MRINVTYEQKFKLNINTVYNLSFQWLNAQYKSKIRNAKSPNFIEAKQGTMMTNTGHDPNWKKKIRISLYELDKVTTLIRIDASPLSRNILRIEKLRNSWFEGLFKYLMNTLQSAEISNPSEKNINIEIMEDSDRKKCPNCGESLELTLTICPYCGIIVRL